MAHSKWNASGFQQKMLCPGSHVLQVDAPDGTSVYSAEGTAAHHLLTVCLQQNTDAAFHKGIKIACDERGRVIWFGADGPPAEYVFPVDVDMVEAVQACLDYVRAAAGQHGVVLVDRKVNYADHLDVPTEHAWGTLDVAIVQGDELTVVDYKHGMGVRVDAQDNPQIMLYALGMLVELGDVCEINRVRMVICQPRINAISEWDLDVDSLQRWAMVDARRAIQACREAEDTDDLTPFLRPGEKQCKFCRAKATCPALRDDVGDTVHCALPASPDDFASATVVHPGEDATSQWLAACLGKVDMIEDWCKAIRAEADRRLQSGEPVPGFKLVAGKRGPRAWADAAQAEEALKGMRLKHDQMYDYKVISPTTAEKLAKAGDIGPRQWPKLQALITQSEGKLHVAPESDSRPAVVVTAPASDFDDETASDLA